MFTRKHCGGKCKKITNMTIVGNTGKILTEMHTSIELVCMKCGWKGMFIVGTDFYQAVLKEQDRRNPDY